MRRRKDLDRKKATERTNEGRKRGAQPDPLSVSQLVRALREIKTEERTPPELSTAGPAGWREDAAGAHGLLLHVQRRREGVEDPMLVVAEGKSGIEVREGGGVQRRRRGRIDELVD